MGLDVGVEGFEPPTLPIMSECSEANLPFDGKNIKKVQLTTAPIVVQNEP